MSQASFYTKPEISVIDKMANVSTFSDSIEKYNSFILKRQTVHFPCINKSSFVSGVDSVIQFDIVSNQGGDLNSAVLYFNAKTGGVDATIQCFNDLITSCFKRVVMTINDSLYEDIDNFHILFKNLFYNTVDHDYLTSQGDLIGAWRYNYKYNTLLSSLKTEGGAVPYLGMDITDRNKLFPVMSCIDILNEETASKTGRTYGIPLSMIFSLFRIEQILPLELVKNIKLFFYLAPYQEACIELPARPAASATDAAALLVHGHRLFTSKTVAATAAQQNYTISNPRISMDMLDLDNEYLQELRKLASSNTGFFVMSDSYSLIPTSLTGAVQSIYISQPISHLKDIFVIPKRTNITTAYSLCDSNAHGYGTTAGSSYRVTIGSTPLTLNPIESLTEAYYEVRKAFNGLGNLNSSTVVDSYLYKNYCFMIGQNCEALSVSKSASSIDLKLPSNYIRLDLNLGTLADTDIAATPLLVGVVQADYSVTILTALHYDIGLHFSNGQITRII